MLSTGDEGDTFTVSVLTVYCLRSPSEQKHAVSMPKFKCCRHQRPTILICHLFRDIFAPSFASQATYSGDK